MLFCVLLSYPDGREEKFWPNCAPLSVFASYNLHIPSCKNSNRGEGGGVEDGVIAKSLLHKTDKTPNPRMHIKWNHRKTVLNLIVFQWIKPKK